LPGNSIVKDETPSLNEQPDLDEPTEKPMPENVTIVRGTYMVKHTFVIGNVSKWLAPHLREDYASHKWMMYVRDRDDDGIAKIIKKVRYFLHESYKPHDIIDVTCPPFHLSKRGWGEFPVRVTIFFQNPQNKPVNVIHTLKLDQESIGEQVPGSETVIEVNLVHENLNEIPQSVKAELVSEPSRLKIPDIITMEHDYFSVKPEIPQKEPVKKSSNLGVSQSVTNPFEYNPMTDGPIKQWYKNDVLKKAGAIYFLSTEACVKWFLKLWPIITNLAESPHYKMVHPYSFPNYRSFFMANVGKRLACEWHRCQKIRKMLITLNLTPWTTKQISLYSKMHGYFISPASLSFQLPNRAFLNISTFTNFLNTSRDFRQLNSNIKEEDVDIIGDDAPVGKIVSPKKLVTDSVTFVSSSVRFVETTSRQLGIRLQNEELVEGVSVNAPSQILAKVLQLFLDDLVRKSYCNAWLRNNLRNPGSLDVADVLQCILETPEFDVFTNVGLGSKSKMD